MKLDDHARRRRPRRLTEDEHALWRHVARSVTPLRRPAVDIDRPPGDAELRELVPPPPRPMPAPSVPRRVAPGPKPAQAPAPAPSLAPLERRLKQRLARGSETIDARIDLHGMTQSEAHGALLHFLRRSQANEAKVVLVITGKGTFDRSGDRERGVLKRQVPQWLRLPEFRAFVVGFENAAISHGGEGALYLRLRRKR
jgi:DNA-nicking Smr family endonuclease